MCNWDFMPDYFFKFFWKTSVLSVASLITLFWTSGDIGPGFQSQGGSPRLHASFPACNRILRLTFGITPADLLAASMATEPFFPCTCEQVLVELETGICHVFLNTDHLLNWNRKIFKKL